jgi:hypothetical protein
MWSASTFLRIFVSVLIKDTDLFVYMSCLCLIGVTVQQPKLEIESVSGQRVLNVGYESLAKYNLRTE